MKSFQDETVEAGGEPASDASETSELIKSKFSFLSRKKNQSALSAKIYLDSVLRLCKNL